MGHANSGEAVVDEATTVHDADGPRDVPSHDKK